VCLSPRVLIQQIINACKKIRLQPFNQEFLQKNTYNSSRILLKNIAKDLVGFSSLVEKGFPGYFLCSCAWCFFL
jgi:hypothetical protein